MAKFSIFLITVALIAGMVGCGQPEHEYTPMVVVDHWHTVGLKADGNVVAVGLNTNGQCSVDGWMDIIQVAAGWWHTVGLKGNGTVVAIGNNGYWGCNVGGWTLN